MRAYDIDRNGDAANERVLIFGITGVAGGLRTDEQGNLYVAGKGISVYTPQGKLLHFLETHERASNCGFGEGDLKTLFITSGANVYRARFDAH